MTTPTETETPGTFAAINDATAMLSSEPATAIACVECGGACHCGGMAPRMNQTMQAASSSSASASSSSVVATDSATADTLAASRSIHSIPASSSSYPAQSSSSSSSSSVIPTPAIETHQHGLVYFHYNPHTNFADVHVRVGQGLSMADVRTAAVHIAELMDGRPGIVQLAPQGAVVLKLVIDILGSALGRVRERTLARLAKLSRQQAPRPEMNSLADRMHRDIMDEHMAFLDALVGVQGLTITNPLASGGNINPDQNLLEDTDNGVLARAYYATIVVDIPIPDNREDTRRTPSLLVQVESGLLPEIIQKLS